MKRCYFPRIEVIQTEDPKEFQEEFNDKIKQAFLDNESERHSPTYSIDFTGGKFTAMITTEVLHEEMDSVADEYHAQGIYYKCRECPYCEVPEDKRIRWCYCEIDETDVNKRHEACEYFYAELKAGRLEPVER